jgi:prolipoprotein diacylglyceryltransferase
VIDLGLIWTLVAMGAVVWAFGRIADPVTLERGSLVDTMWLPLLVGAAVARFVYLLLAGALVSTGIGGFLLVRNGVSFWPGLVAGCAVVIAAARRERVDPWMRVADLAPVALAAYGAFEATCILRDGCYGPITVVGLTPSGLTQPQFPVGIVVGGAAVASAVLLERWWELRPRTVALAALGTVAGLRWITWFLLPRAPGTGAGAQWANTIVLVGVGLVHTVTTFRRIESSRATRNAQGDEPT